MWLQRQITLTAKFRGLYLISDKVLSSLLEFKKVETGLAHFFLQHTSSSLSLNLNADASARRDLEFHFNVLVPESASYYEYIYGDVYDMHAHIKSSLLGSFLSLPIHNGEIMLGIWKGLVLGGHRDAAGSRCGVQ